MTFHGYMRATVFAPKRAKYPALVQPKHNGIRCLWDDETAWSREGHIFKPHIHELCRKKFGTGGKWVRDGELILPRFEFSLQQTQSAVTAEGEHSHLLQMPVFDVHNRAIGGPVFSERQASGLIDTQTIAVTDYEEVEYWYDTFLEMGFEGLIFRTDTSYLFGSAARNLMKKKPVKHAEFIIVGVWQGEGKNLGVPIYRLARPDVAYIHGAPATSKNTFGCVPKGEYWMKKWLWEQHKDGSVKGKMYTIECADFYDSGVPQFPIGIGVRDYE